MNTDEYINERVDSQILWYSKKAAHFRIMFVRVQMLVMMFALLVPMLLIFSMLIEVASTYLISAMASVLSIVTAFLVALQSFQNNKDKWASYQATAESLKMEKVLFLTSAGEYSYKDKEDAFKLFVSRVENIIQTEQTEWSSLVKKHREFIPEER